MNSWVSPKMLVALLLAVIGAAVAGLMPGALERIIVVTVTMLAGFFIVADPYEAESDAPNDIVADLSDAGDITANSQLQPVIDASTDAIIIVGNAKVSAANQFALSLLGNNIVGQNVRMALRHAGAIERLSDPQAEHKGQPIRLTGIGQPGQLWDMRIQSIGNGEKLVQLADRSAVQAAEKMRVDFVANASHELLTPLAAVKGFIETLGDPAAGDDPETRNRFLGIMAKETDRMQALVRDLMSLSRIEAEKYDPPQVAVDFAATVAETIDALRDGLKQRSGDLEIDIAPGLKPVVGDPGQLQQLANNIITNAMKYGKNGAPVKVTLAPSRSGNMLAFSVVDEGDGIAPEHLPRLTERFYRVDSGRSRSIGGTGLGLSLVKHIVDRHRGHLEIRSVVGTGTTVTVMLPVAPPAS